MERTDLAATRFWISLYSAAPQPCAAPKKSLRKLHNLNCQPTLEKRRWPGSTDYATRRAERQRPFSGYRCSAQCRATQLCFGQEAYCKKVKKLYRRSGTVCPTSPCRTDR